MRFVGARIGAAVVGYSGNPMSRYSFEFDSGKNSGLQPADEFGQLRNRVPRTLEVARIRGDVWHVLFDGREPQQHTHVAIPGSSAGLPTAHAYLSSYNAGAPCDNHGSFRFSHVMLRAHGSHTWSTFPDTTGFGASPGQTMHLISRTSFTAGTLK